MSPLSSSEECINLRTVFPVFRFGFQGVALAALVAVLAVGCGDDGGTPQTMNDPTPPAGGGNDDDDDDTPDACAGLPNPQSTNSECPGYEEPMPSMPWAEDLKSSNAMTRSHQVLNETASGKGDSGTEDFVALRYPAKEGNTGKSIHITQGDSSADTGKFLVASMFDFKSMEGKLSYSLDFYEYDLSGGGTEGSNIGTNRPVTSLGVRPAIFAGFLADNASHGGKSKFKVSSSSMVNTENMNLMNFGFGDGYTTAILKSRVDMSGDKKYDATVYAQVYSDHNTARKKDGDYLAGGVWMIIPDTKSLKSGYHFGAFADGANPFTGGIKVAVEGEATYEGKALGFYSKKGDMIKSLTGNVTLNADFLDSSDAGHISGIFGNLKLDGKAVSGAIALPRVTFPNDGDGKINGYDTTNFRSEETTSIGQIDGMNFMGSWAGTFFGNTETDATKPTAVAGVIKGNSEKDASFVASFATREK